MLDTTKQLLEPLDAVIFDCDGTLSILEGINELAKANAVVTEVERLTEQAMSHTGLNPDLYQRRLELVKPTLAQVKTLGEAYCQRLAPDVLLVIQALQTLAKSVYVFSAGVNPAVQTLAKFLKIPSTHVFAVDLSFDEQGHYLDFDRDSWLVHNDGKRRLVEQLSLKHRRIGYVGDGMNDYVVYDVVQRFIGYGGVFYRETLAQRCEYYSSEASMLAILPWLLTSNEQQSLS